MKDQNQTEMRLINELAELRKRIAELETLENERKQTEEALRQSEERYRSILENMQEVYYEIDLAGNWIFLNEAFYEHLGYRKEELIGKNSRQYQDETTARELYQAYTRLYHTGEPIKAIEAKWISKDGTKRTYEMSASLMRDPEGKPIGFRGISRDITERKRMEEALKESERRLADIIDFLPDATMVIDREGKVIAWNRAMEVMTGVEAKDMLGKGGYEYAIPFYGERRPILIDLVTQPQEEIEMKYEHIEKRPDGMLMGENYIPNLKGGELYFFGASAPLYDRRGNLVGAIESIRDITEHKRAEEEYKTILRTAMDGFWVTDIEGHFLGVNAAYCRLVGYSRDELLTMRISDVEAVERPEETAQRIQRIMETGGDRFETRHKCKDGRMIDVEVSVNYMKAGDGRLFVFLRDITERKKMEEALRESEHKFRSLVESSIVGVYLIQDGVFKYVNSRFAEIHGYKIGEMVDKLGPKQATLPEDWPVAEENVRKRTSGEVDFAHYELRNVTKTREIRNVEIFGSRTVYQGRPAVIGTMLDITERKRVEEERKKLIHELQEAIANIKQLRGLLPICANCKKIRDDKGYWNQIESYIQDHSGAEFSHGMCPECLKKLYPDFVD